MYRNSLLLLTLLTSLAQAQSTSLRQTWIFAGDIAELRITYDSELPAMYVVDTTPLETDFEVLDISTSMSRLQRDNRALHRMHWNALLVPRRSGLLSIPPLHYGANQTKALQLNVKPVPAELEASQNVFIELEAIPRNPYPGQQTRIVTRLYHNQPLQHGILGEPESDQGQAFRSIRDTHYEVTRDTETFSVLERSILLIPQQAGDWQIQPASFRGSVKALPAGETGVLDGASRYIYRDSNSLLLQVRALPKAGVAAHWLPARHLEMSLQWEQGNELLEPGESIGLSLDLQATGLPAGILPADLLLRESDQYRIYADQVKRSTRVEGPPGDEVLNGHLQQRYVIVFEQAGEVTLPPVELAWWDTAQDRERIARIEATTLTITTPASPLDHLNVGRGEEPTGTAAFALPLQWLGMALAGLVLLGMPWLARRRSRRFLTWLGQLRRQRGSRRLLEQACADNDAVAARRELIAWGRARWNDEHISSLRQIAARCGLHSWTTEMARLDAAVFAEQHDAWQGQGLRRLLKQQQRGGTARKRRRGHTLPEPYPRRTDPHSCTNRA